MTVTNQRRIGDDERGAYWEARARRYATVGAGLGAVCSYGMPRFYNAYIHALQSRALAPWLAVAPGTSVLEIGCGVGRWTRQFARAGAHVVGFDLSPTMIAEARRRAAGDPPSGSCRFMVADVTNFSLNRQFDRLFGVTVLQHVLEPERLRSAAERIAEHLAPGGIAVLLEAAPTTGSSRCNNPIFVARHEATYLSVFRRAGLACLATAPVDPAPFRMLMLPWYRALPRPIALTGLMASTLASIPIDFGPRWARPDTSWHKVFVLASANERRAA